MKPETWWTRPCGGRDVLRLALPLIVSTASWSVMNFIDRMFLFWYSKEAMAAVLPAWMVLFSVVCFPLGIASYVNTFVAQYHGAGQPKRIGPAVWQGARVGLYCIPLFLAMIPLAPWIFFDLAGHEGELASQETLFFQISAAGAGAEVLAAALSAFFTGLGITRVVMVVDTSATILNAVLDYGLIFGRFGLPGLGIEGAAWATAASLWFRVFAYAGLMMMPRYRRPYRLWGGRRFDGALFRRLLRYGGPNGLQMLVDVVGFTLFLMLVGLLGSDAMAATSLAFNINALAFVPMLGLGIAVSTIVGHQLGSNQPDLAARGTQTAFGMAMVYMGVMAAVYVLLPDVLLMGHAAGTPSAEFNQLHDTIVVLLRFVAVYCVFDAMNVVFSGALKGAGDVRFILLISLLITPIPLLAAWIGIRWAGGGLVWCWTIATLWISVLGLIYGARFLVGHWREMRVIEPDLLR